MREEKRREGKDEGEEQWVYAWYAPSLHFPSPPSTILPILSVFFALPLNSTATGSTQHQYTL